MIISVCAEGSPSVYMSRPSEPGTNCMVEGVRQPDAPVVVWVRVRDWAHAAMHVRSVQDIAHAKNATESWPSDLL